MDSHDARWQTANESIFQQALKHPMVLGSAAWTREQTAIAIARSILDGDPGLDTMEQLAEPSVSPVSPVSPALAWFELEPELELEPEQELELDKGHTRRMPFVKLTK